MYVNNNLYFVVGNLVTEIYFFQEVIIYLCLGEKSVFLANSPYFPLSSIIPFVRLTFQSTYRVCSKVKPSIWIQLLYSIRTPCMEMPPRLLTRKLKEPAREPLLVNTRDAWFAAHQLTMSVTWTRP